MDDADVDFKGNPAGYLAGDAVVEVGHPWVEELSSALRSQHDTDVEYARAAFEWVRDQIAHSLDAQDPRS